ncbi:hypothetical protein [Dokdonia sp.]|uniref:hypothetical protein n=1 Tax=Dokdonia sp. TaxID=2024995 RepID=UPI003263EFE4
MGIIFVIIGYFFDYKSDKENFFKDLAIGLGYFIGNFILAMILNQVFHISLLYCIFGFGIEIILLFALKAYVQNKTN